MKKIGGALRHGLQFGAILLLVNLLYQSFLWVTELNRQPTMLAVFFAFFPIVLCVLFFIMRRKRFGYPHLVLAGVATSFVGAVGIFLMMYLFLNVIGGGVLPPVLAELIASLEARAAAGEDVSAELERYQRLTPTSFAIGSAIQNFVFGCVEAIIIAIPFAMRSRKFG